MTAYAKLNKPLLDLSEFNLIPFSMSTRIVVLGVAGMLGHKMFQRLRAEFPGSVLGIMREQAVAPPLNRVDLLQGSDVVSGVDVLDFLRLRELLEDLRPRYIVNCVGIIKQRPEVHDAVPTIAINALLPHQLAAVSGSWGGRLIHFSTDCVFSGSRGRYTESDFSDARDLYGRSKFLGEVDGPNALTLRTSIIGRELTQHRSLLDWVLSQDGGVVHGFTRAIFSGVTTNHLASLVGRVIRNHQTLQGLYQVASNPVRKYDLLCLIRDAFSLDLEVIPDSSEDCDRSMLGDRLRSAIGYQSPSWPELVTELAQDPTPYESWIRS